MKIVLITFASLLVLIVSAQKPQRKIETIITDLNNDNRPDTLFLYSTLNDNSVFNKIKISLTGFHSQSFKAKDEWTIVDSAFLSDNKNLVKSNRLFLYKAKDHSIILLFGVLDGADYREDFSVINIKNSKAFMVFDKGNNDIDIEIPIALKDIDNDNRTEFIFRNFGEIYMQTDSLNADIGTYNPYLVYTIDDKFVLNRVLTKKYNEAHYVFAGYRYSEKIKVLYPRDKKQKPRILK